MAVLPEGDQVVALVKNSTLSMAFSAPAVNAASG